MPFVVLKAKSFFKNSPVKEVDAEYFHGRAMRA